MFVSAIRPPAFPMTHGHDNSHGHHDHAAHADLNTADGRRRVAIAGIVTAVFMVVETNGGIISGSLALLADAAHMFTDAESLALAWLGYFFAARPADDTRSFGSGRLRALAAFTNELALLALAVWIVIDGIQRLANPQPIIGSLMLWVAICSAMWQTSRIKHVPVIPPTRVILQPIPANASSARARSTTPMSVMHSSSIWW